MNALSRTMSNAAATEAVYARCSQRHLPRVHGHPSMGNMGNRNRRSGNVTSYDAPMSDTLRHLADEARPRSPLTDDQRSEMQALVPDGAVIADWTPPMPRIEPETARERQLYRMGYYDGACGAFIDAG